MFSLISNCTRTVTRRQQFSGRAMSMLTNGLSSVDLEEEFGIFPSVKLKGLPYDAKLADVTEFLNGLHPIDVIVPTKDNKTGSVGVLFSNMDDAEAALQRNKDTIGSRYIDVILIRRSEYYRMAAEAVMGGAVTDVEHLRGVEEGSVVKMEGLPFEATPADVQKFFAGFDVPQERVIFEARNDGRPSGVAFVVFSSSHEAVQAMQYNRAYMGRRYVILQATRTDFALNCRKME